MGGKAEEAHFGERISEMLREEEIRFCGIVSSGGDLVAGKFRKGKLPFEGSEGQQRIFRDLSARVAARKKFDHTMGRVKYSASRRERLVMISFPVGEATLLITAEPNVNIDRLAFKIIQILASRRDLPFDRQQVQ